MIFKFRNSSLGFFFSKFFHRYKSYNKGTWLFMDPKLQVGHTVCCQSRVALPLRVRFFFFFSCCKQRSRSRSWSGWPRSPSGWCRAGTAPRSPNSLSWLFPGALLPPSSLFQLHREGGLRKQIWEVLPPVNKRFFSDFIMRAYWVKESLKCPLLDKQRNLLTCGLSSRCCSSANNLHLILYQLVFLSLLWLFLFLSQTPRCWSPHDAVLGPLFYVYAFFLEEFIQVWCFVISSKHPNPHS